MMAKAQAVWKCKDQRIIHHKHPTAAKMKWTLTSNKPNPKELTRKDDEKEERWKGRICSTYNNVQEGPRNDGQNRIFNYKLDSSDSD
jgi:hypothetical protein